MRPSFVVGAVVVAAVALAGCSSSSTVSTQSSSPARPTPIVTGSSTLPTSYPSDIPQPKGLTLIRATTSSVDGQDRYAIYYQGSTPVAEVESQMAADLSKAGYVKTRQVQGGVMVTNWKNNSYRVGVNVTEINGVTNCLVTVRPVNSG